MCMCVYEQADAYQHVILCIKWFSIFLKVYIANDLKKVYIAKRKNRNERATYFQ